MIQIFVSTIKPFFRFILWRSSRPAGRRRRCWASGAAGRRASPRAVNPSVMHRHDSIFSWYKTFFSIFLVTIIATCNAGSRRRCWARGAAGRKASPRAVHPSTQLFVGIDYFVYQIIALTRTWLIFFFMKQNTYLDKFSFSGTSLRFQIDNKLTCISKLFCWKMHGCIQ